MKRREIVFSPEARHDLLQIYDWIAERAGDDIALGYIERLEAFCRSRALSPLRGRRRDDVRPGLRVVGFQRRIAVAFTVEANVVVILGLYYGGRNWG